MILQADLPQTGKPGHENSEEKAGKPYRTAVMGAKFRCKFLPNSVNSIGNDGEIRIRDEGSARMTLLEDPLREFAKVDSFEGEIGERGIRLPSIVARTL